MGLSSEKRGCLGPRARERGVGEACCNSFIFHAHLPGTFWLLIPGRQDVASAYLHACTHTLRSREGDRTLFFCWVCAGRRWAWTCSLSLRPASRAGLLSVGAESWGQGRKGKALLVSSPLWGWVFRTHTVLFLIALSWLLPSSPTNTRPKRGNRGL